MYSIIPLAGPDFYSEQYGIKPLFNVDGESLLKKTINSRQWIKDGEVAPEDFIFIVKTSPHLKEFQNYLNQEFPKAKIVEISDFTKGALMSCLSATALITDFTKPIAVDLEDILFDMPKDFSILQKFKNELNLDAILPVFDSNNMQYSYADIDKNGYVLKTKEKQGWDFGKEKLASGKASAGVYFFKNLAVFLNAAADSVGNCESYAYKGNLFLCPAINGVVKDGLKVAAFEVQNVNSYSLRFKLL